MAPFFSSLEGKKRKFIVLITAFALFGPSLRAAETDVKFISLLTNLRLAVLDVFTLPMVTRSLLRPRREKSSICIQEGVARQSNWCQGRSTAVTLP